MTQSGKPQRPMTRADTQTTARTNVVKCMMSDAEKKRVTLWKRAGRYNSDAEYLRAAALAGAPDLLAQLLAKVGDHHIILAALERQAHENPELDAPIRRVIEAAQCDLDLVLNALRRT